MQCALDCFLCLRGYRERGLKVICVGVEEEACSGDHGATQKVEGLGQRGVRCRENQ
jgi:hypothetical protein